MIFKVSIGGLSTAYDTTALPSKAMALPVRDEGQARAWNIPVDELDPGAVVTFQEWNDGRWSALVERGELLRAPHPTMPVSLEVDDGEPFVGDVADGTGLYVTANQGPVHLGPLDVEPIPPVMLDPNAGGSPNSFPGDVVVNDDAITRAVSHARRPALYRVAGIPYDADIAPDTALGETGIEPLWDRKDVRGREEWAAKPWRNSWPQHANGVGLELLEAWWRLGDVCILRMAMAQIELLLGWKGIGFDLKDDGPAGSLAQSSWLVHPRYYGRAMQVLARAVAWGINPNDRYRRALDRCIRSVRLHRAFAETKGWRTALVYAPEDQKHIPGTPYSSVWGTAELVKGLCMAHIDASFAGQEDVSGLIKTGVATIMSAANPSMGPGHFFDDIGAKGGLKPPASNTDLWCAPGLFAARGFLAPRAREIVEYHLRAMGERELGGFGRIRTFGRPLIKWLEGGAS